MSSPHALPTPDEVYISHVRLRDVDDQALSLSGWEQEYHQLSPGRYEGSVSWCSMKGIEFFVESSNQQLHQAGKVTNRKGSQFDGFSITTFAAGVPELYTWLHENEEVRFLPVKVVN